MGLFGTWNRKIFEKPVDYDAVANDAMIHLGQYIAHTLNENYHVEATEEVMRQITIRIIDHMKADAGV